MQLEILQESLNKALSLVSHVVSTKPNLPILGNINLETNQDQIIIAATDLDVGMKVNVKAKILQEGSISVPAKLFVDFISSLPSGSVVLETEGLLLNVRSGSYVSRFNCMDSDEFPPFPQKGETSAFTFPKKELKNALTPILFSASTDMSRQILTGILFEFQKKTVNLVTTDGFRLSLETLPIETENLENIIIPARGLSELTRTAEEVKNDGKSTPQVFFYLSENKNQIIVNDNNVEIILRLLEGQYPDYKKIIPTSSTTSITIDREELSKAVKVAAIFARDNANIIHFSLKKEPGTLEIRAQAKEMGEGASTLHPVIEGEDLNIAFNARFLNEILGALQKEQLIITFSGALKPIKIVEAGNDTFFHVLMPVRTGN